MEKSISHPSYKLLIAKLVKARKSNKLTIRELGDLLGEDHTFVAKTETNLRKLSVIEFIQYAKTLNLDPAELIKAIEGKLK